MPAIQISSKAAGKPSKSSKNQPSVSTQHVLRNADDNFPKGLNLGQSWQDALKGMAYHRDEKGQVNIYIKAVVNRPAKNDNRLLVIISKPSGVRAFPVAVNESNGCVLFNPKAISGNKASRDLETWLTEKLEGVDLPVLPLCLIGTVAKKAGKNMTEEEKAESIRFVVSMIVYDRALVINTNRIALLLNDVLKIKDLGLKSCPLVFMSEDTDISQIDKDTLSSSEHADPSQGLIEFNIGKIVDEEIKNVNEEEATNILTDFANGVIESLAPNFGYCDKSSVGFVIWYENSEGVVDIDTLWTSSKPPAPETKKGKKGKQVLSEDQVDDSESGSTKRKSGDEAGQPAKRKRETNKTSKKSKRGVLSEIEIIKSLSFATDGRLTAAISSSVQGSKSDNLALYLLVVARWFNNSLKNGYPIEDGVEIRSGTLLGRVAEDLGVENTIEFRRQCAVALHNFGHAMIEKKVAARLAKEQAEAEAGEEGETEAGEEGDAEAEGEAGEGEGDAEGEGEGDAGAEAESAIDV